MEVPPPFAILQASRGAKRRSSAWQEEPGGSWRCAAALGEFLESESFHWKDQFSITCVLGIGRLAKEPVFSRVEWRREGSNESESLVVLLHTHSQSIGSV